MYEVLTAVVRVAVDQGKEIGKNRIIRTARWEECSVNNVVMIPRGKFNLKPLQLAGSELVETNKLNLIVRACVIKAYDCILVLVTISEAGKAE